MSKVAVVIPVYRELNELEKISLAQCRKILGRYPLVFVAPEGKIFSYFKSGDMVAHFPAKYFQSVQTYSRLLTSPQFYEPFADFDYILIYQLDAFVFYDALEEFCSLGYDYIGAPWPWLAEVGGKFLRVGNGGFSLRKVKAHYNLLLNHADWIVQHENLNEDTIFSFCGAQDNCNFRVAPINVAYKFSMEFNPDRCIRKNGGNLPFGCHGWSTLTENFYVKNFWPLFLDAQTIEKLSIKPEDKLTNWLYLIAIKRFNRRLKNGRSLSRYLPTKHFASIRVIRSSGAMKILSRLLTEKNSLTDKIFLYDEENRTDLLRDVMCEDSPHLIISAEDDVSLITAVERQGLRYGEHVISFQREYLKHCEEFFHKLGK
ncbi:MAG: hypothetical protein IKE46_08615 [Selenomonadaceae bacterium]|nr:hypothetical protein [Selenomonadaceae bacterium]